MFSSLSQWSVQWEVGTKRFWNCKSAAAPIALFYNLTCTIDPLWSCAIAKHSNVARVGHKRVCTSTPVIICQTEGLMLVWVYRSQLPCNQMGVDTIRCNGSKCGRSAHTKAAYKVCGRTHGGRESMITYINNSCSTSQVILGSSGKDIFLFVTVSYVSQKPSGGRDVDQRNLTEYSALTLRSTRCTLYLDVHIKTGFPY